MKFFCAIFLSTALAVFAQTETNTIGGASPQPVRDMSLQDCLQEALAHNFDVQVERYAPQISLYDLDAAYGGWDPTAKFSAEHNFNVSGGGLTAEQIAIPATTSKSDTFNAGVGGLLPWGLQYDFSGNIGNRTFQRGITNFTQSGSGSIGVTLVQPLLKNFWIDGTRLSIKLAKSQLKVSEQQLRLQFITTVTAVENAYYELIFARENVKVNEQALHVAQTQLDQDKQRVQVGSLAPLDVQQDEAQLAQNRANLISAQYNLQAAQNTLKNLITDSYVKWHDIDIQPTATLEAPLQLFDLQSSWGKGMTGRPDLVQARLNLEQQGIRLKYDLNQLFPELDLIGSYGFNGSSTGLSSQYNETFGQWKRGDQPFYSYGAQISYPLSNVGAWSSYKAQKLSKQQALLQLKQFEQNVMVQIDNAVKQAQSSYQSVDATRQARVYAEAALDAEQKKYNVGKSTTFTVLQLQNSLTGARSQEIRSLANYNEALANLAQQEGSTLEQSGVKVEIK